MDAVFLPFFLLTVFEGAIAQLQLEPSKSVVLRGTDARFNCSLSQPNWVIMAWSLNGGLVLTIHKDSGAITNSPRYNASDYTTEQSYKWEFVLYNTQLNESGDVTCDVQNIGKKTATLSVQESGTVKITTGNVTAKRNQLVPIDCLALSWLPEPQLTWILDGIPVNQDKYNISTEASGGLLNSASTLTVLVNDSVPVECQATVPALAVPQTSTIFLTMDSTEGLDRTAIIIIAVVVPIVGVALLVLLIIGIIFCCKRRKVTKSSYEEDVRRTRSQSERNTADVVLGEDNNAYLPDGSKQDVAPSAFKDSGFAQTNSFHGREMPDVLYNSNHAVNGHDPISVQGTLGSKKHRQATIV